MSGTDSDTEEVSDSELFLKNTEAWYRKHHPDWSEEEIKSALRDVRFSSLLEFYEEATRLYPDLKVRFTLLPVRPYGGYFSPPSPGAVDDQQDDR